MKMLATVTLFLPACIPFLLASAASLPATVDHVDLGRYEGTWYEIAAIPQPFEEGCVGSKATYRVAGDEMLQVVNSCREQTADGPLLETAGMASVVDPATNAKLKVTFTLPSGTSTGDYWILALDGDYQFALVGVPDRSALWILDRSPHPSAAVVAQLTEVARAKGYDVTKLRLSAQP